MHSWLMSQRDLFAEHKLFDWGLFWLPLALMTFGLVMISSASIDYAALKYHDPWIFTKKHSIYISLSMLVGFAVFIIPVQWWNKCSIVFMFLGLGLLAAVLMPQIGKSVNGSRRWFELGPITIQASEIAKFCFVIFFASFLSRRIEEFRTSWSAFFKLIFILAWFVGLLLAEPDFGSSVVLCISGGAMMFMAGVPIIRFILLSLTGVLGLVIMAVTTPYRWQRLVTFLDPWSEQYSHGYQLVQSLIAFGRGQWFGLGLGNSLQKLFFLPEAHTDFIFAIIAEELGFIGVLVLILCFSLLIWRIFMLAKEASDKKEAFISFVAIGVGTVFAAQIFINMGVASGLLPTKGLTLPFISAGGSSLIISTAFMALLLKMNWEIRK